MLFKKRVNLTQYPFLCVIDATQPRMTYTNIGIDARTGALMPWRNGKTSYHPPLVQFDGQFWFELREMS